MRRLLILAAMLGLVGCSSTAAPSAPAAGPSPVPAAPPTPTQAVCVLTTKAPDGLVSITGYAPPQNCSGTLVRFDRGLCVGGTGAARIEPEYPGCTGNGGRIVEPVQDTLCWYPEQQELNPAVVQMDGSVYCAPAGGGVQYVSTKP